MLFVSLFSFLFFFCFVYRLVSNSVNESSRPTDARLPVPTPETSARSFPSSLRPSIEVPAHKRPCVLGALLNLDATPARMTVFVDGEPLEVQCEYDLPKDGRAWYPSVALGSCITLHSCAM